MTQMRIFLTSVAAILLSAAHDAQAPTGSSKPAKQTAATAFAAMQERGRMAMGVDQYTSTHKFDSFPNGGRIELQRDKDDTAGVAAIRAHIRDIAHAFKTGDFSTPDFVHMQAVPGTKEMAALREKITYQ